MNEFERPKNDCPAVGYQEVDVCVPVTVKPFANVLTPKIKHVGTPVVCAGEGECRGGCGNICKFTISQKIKVLYKFHCKKETLFSNIFYNNIRLIIK